MSYENFRRQYLEGKTSCVEAVQACLNAIESTRQYNIYVQVFADEAMQAARALDALPKEQLKPLAGCILALKDNLAYKDHSVSASSKMLEGYTSLYTATAVQRLLDAGAIVIGTTGCDEF
ncbi:MAG: amidase family protein, partial [Sphingobacteriia bacterium]